MLDRRELALMQPHAYLITTARGGIVNEDALADALPVARLPGLVWTCGCVNRRRLNHRLLAFDNVIATYHTAGVTVDSRDAMAQWNAEQIVHIFQGKRPPRLVNPEVWPKFARRFEQAFGFRPES